MVHSTAELLAKCKALRKEAGWNEKRLTWEESSTVKRIIEGQSALSDVLQRRHDISVSLLWIKSSLEEIRLKSQHMKDVLEGMSENVQTFSKKSGKTSLSRTVSVSSWISVVSEEDFSGISSSSVPDRSFTFLERDSVSPTSDLAQTPDSMSLPPSHSASADTLCSGYSDLGDTCMDRKMEFSFSEDLVDMGVFV
eukprot:m.309116 g.309116  ORF g.309116 m.309116 type:complete len:195 (+) comp45530_c0_seq1:1009-1593(+)